LLWFEQQPMAKEFMMNATPNTVAPRALILVLSLGAALMVLGASTSAQAQYRARGRGNVSVAIVPPGVYGGIGLVATKIVSQNGGDELLEDGAGLSFFMGIKLNERLALEGGIASTFHNPVAVQTSFGNDVDYLVLTAATVDAKIFFPTQGQHLVPFAQGGVGLYLLDSEYFGAQSVGTGFQLGGGFDLPLGPQIDLGLRALYRGMAMGPPESNADDTFVSALSAEANIAVHF
jgi:hypothetical protein